MRKFSFHSSCKKEIVIVILLKIKMLIHIYYFIPFDLMTISVSKTVFVITSALFYICMNQDLTATGNVGS